MNINAIKKELENSNFKIEYEIKNNNEIYIGTQSNMAVKITGYLIKDCKLVFCAEFCKDIGKLQMNIVLTGRKENYYVIVRYIAIEYIESLQGIVYQSNMFEREISDLFGLQINGAIDNRHLVKHEIWNKDVYPLKKEFNYGEKVKPLETVEDYQFKSVSYEAYQIPVGPVHAGIIEPGHFRFSVMGEPIENLEIRLMYKHRGIEKLCENIDGNNLNLVFERVAGESTVAYAESYALLVEKLTDFLVSNETKALRVVLLELERIYNFLDDIGGICVDVGFSYPAKRYGYFSELIHQLCERITGSRFCRNSIVPFGINVHYGEKKRVDILNTLQSIEVKIERIVKSTLDSVSFLDRVEHTGMVDKETAKKLLLTGVVGRACGKKYDVRKNFPYEIYGKLKNEINVESLGGVFERYKLKIAEIKDAFSFIRKALNFIDGDIEKSTVDVQLPEGREAFVSVETVKGELVVYGAVGKNNKFDRIYFKTPSFTNWEGITIAVQGEIVPDFPLCNKSFNMSYSENDR